MNHNPWDNIYNDYVESEKILDKILETRIDTGHVVIDGLTELPSPKERIEYAFSLAMSLRPELEQCFIDSEIDVYFLWIWGEYQSAISTLTAAYPEFQKHQPITLASVERGKIKKRARQWYALWYEWYKEQDRFKSKTRKAFDRYFEKILIDLKLNKRQAPQKHRSQIKKLISAFTEEGDTSEDVILTGYFTTDKFSNSELNKLVSIFNDGRADLPPVGEEHYLK